MRLKQFLKSIQTISIEPRRIRLVGFSIIAITLLVIVLGSRVIHDSQNTKFISNPNQISINAASLNKNATINQSHLLSSTLPSSAVSSTPIITAPDNTAQANSTTSSSYQQQTSSSYTSLNNNSVTLVTTPPVQSDNNSVPTNLSTTPTPPPVTLPVVSNTIPNLCIGVTSPNYITTQTIDNVDLHPVSPVVHQCMTPYAGNKIPE